MSLSDLNNLLAAVEESPSLLWFQAKPLVRGERDSRSAQADQETGRLIKLVRERLYRNVRQAYGMSYADFEQSEKRFLVSPRDVLLIDSVYRNRDAGPARRGLKKLEKWWEDGDGTLKSALEGRVS